MRRDLDHCMSVGTDRGGPCVVGMFGIISGAAVLAAAVRESVSGHGGEVVAPPAMSSQLVVPARERQDLFRRYHDYLFAGHIRCFPDDLSPTGPY